MWATHLSALLTGKALEVYARLPATEIDNFDKLKVALLKRFALTEDGFRKRFKTARPEQSETFTQFSVRLENYATRWIEMSNTDKVYESLLDLILREQFIQACGKDLSLFLRERTPAHLTDMVKLADQFCEARGGNSTLLSRPSGSQKQSYPVQSSTVTSKSHDASDKTPDNKTGKSVGVNCEFCNRRGHTESRCFLKYPHLKPVAKANAAISKCDVVTQTSPQSLRRKMESVADSSQTPECKPVTDDGLDASNEVVQNVNMPTIQGKVGHVIVTVLRDSGCNGVVIKRSLVDDYQLTGRIQTFYMINGNVEEAPVASVYIDSPYFVGQCDAW